MSDLLELAKRTYETSASILDQAKRLSKHVEASSVRLKETEVEVVTLTYDEEKQLQETGLLCDRLKKEAARRQDDLKAISVKQAEVVKLTELFAVLETVNVAPWITGEAQQQPLLEYVDADAVRRLKADAAAKVGETKELCAAIERKVLSAEAELHQAYETITQAQAKGKEGGNAGLFSFDLESIRSKLREYLHVVKEVQEAQEVSIQEISRISLKAAGAYDALLNGKEEAKKETILGYGESLKEGLKKVAALTQSLNEKLKSAIDIKAHLQNTRPTIEAIHVSLKTLGDSSRSMASAYQAANAEANTLLDELIQLSSFYSDFVAANDSIPGELERRWRYITKVESLAKAQQDELNSLVQKEIAERKAFNNKHGMFLPNSLCPALDQDVLPTSFQYVMANPSDAQLLHECMSKKEEEENSGA